MLKNPEYGCPKICLQQKDVAPDVGWAFVGEPTESTNVPVDTLRAFIHYYKYGVGAAKFEEKFGGFTIFVEFGIVYVIHHASGYDGDVQDWMVKVSVDTDDLADELCQDIQRGINDWAKFYTWNADDEAAAAASNKETLTNMVAELSQLVEEQRKEYELYKLKLGLTDNDDSNDEDLFIVDDDN